MRVAHSYLGCTSQKMAGVTLRASYGKYVFLKVKYTWFNIPHVCFFRSDERDNIYWIVEKCTSACFLAFFAKTSPAFLAVVSHWSVTWDGFERISDPVITGFVWTKQINWNNISACIYTALFLHLVNFLSFCFVTDFFANMKSFNKTIDLMIFWNRK